MKARLRRRDRKKAAVEHPVRDPEAKSPDVHVEIAPDDPLLAHFQQAGGPIELEKLRLESLGLERLKAAGVKLSVPLVSQGELIGVLNLGPRLSEQEYSADDRKLLDSLASQAAPALRVAQLVREQEAEIRTRERYEQELRIAHLIQQNFLPKEAPALAGWLPEAFYRSAREVGGDFYDFIELESGRLGIVIGDVTDKGVPAALMMASTRSIIRSVAQRFDSPGEVLATVNDQLCPEMPPKMFVTCLYAVLEPHSGRLVYANAGHNLPYRKAADCVDELKARGMPLGLLPGSEYEEKEVMIAAGEVVLFTSDGIAEAHSPDGDMYGCKRLIELIENHPHGEDLRDSVLRSLDEFTGPDWEQEDDITMVTLTRTPHQETDFEESPAPRELTSFEITSSPGNEREAMSRVAQALEPLAIGADRLEKIKTAVAEATMNAIEHGNKNDATLPVSISMTLEDGALRIFITDHGGGEEIPEQTAPDLDAKLRGEQSPRGWGLYLIKSMVDELNVSSDGEHHTVELVVRIGEAG